MRRWKQRKLWLALVAAANLLLWGAIALAVSVVAGDRLDLGIESTVRDIRATAIAAWQADRPGSAPAGSADPGDGPALPGGLPAGAGASLHPPAAPLRTAYPPGLQPGGQLVAAATPVPPQGASDTPLPAGPTPSPQAGQAAQAAAGFEPVTAPLLLADPPLGDLSLLDAEMARSAAGRIVQIRYLETTLNAELAALLAGRTDLPYRDVSVDLAGVRVTATGGILVLGLPIQAEVRGTLVAVDCRPRLEIASVKIGRLFTPVVIRDQVEKLVAEALDWYPAGYPLCIDRIVVQDDRATLYGHRR